MIATANPISSSAAASQYAAGSPSLELLEARRARDALSALLRREQVAMADFLVALSDFDRRRGWDCRRRRCGRPPLPKLVRATRTQGYF